MPARILTTAVALLAGVAEAGHCNQASNLPDYCCLIACDSQYANNPSYFGPGTTPPCGSSNAVRLSEIFNTAASQGCSPLTENSCSFGPNAYSRNACEIEQAIPDATGDPHINLPHGGRADFRGEHNAIYNFLSAKDLAVNVVTQMADFELHNESNPRHKHVHGSFLTQAHIVARTSTGKIVRASFWGSMIGPQNVAWANGTVDSEPAFKLGAKMEKIVDDVSLTTDYSRLTVVTPQFEIVVTPKKFRLERNVVGLSTRLDVQFKPRVEEAGFTVPPHGIVGQSWDGDGKAIDGEQDQFPKSGEFTTYAMAKGAIEGVAADYKLASKYATEYKYSRFDATKAQPRDVANLVAAGELNEPKIMHTGAADFVGSTEYNFEHM